MIMLELKQHKNFNSIETLNLGTQFLKDKPVQDLFKEIYLNTAKQYYILFRNNL